MNLCQKYFYPGPNPFTQSLCHPVLTAMTINIPKNGNIICPMLLNGLLKEVSRDFSWDAWSFSWTQHGVRYSCTMVSLYLPETLKQKLEWAFARCPLFQVARCRFGPSSRRRQGCEAHTFAYSPQLKTPLSLEIGYKSLKNLLAWITFYHLSSTTVFYNSKKVWCVKPMFKVQVTGICKIRCCKLTQYYISLFTYTEISFKILNNTECHAYWEPQIIYALKWS